MPRIMTRKELEEVKAYFRRCWNEGQRRRDAVEREYRDAHGLREPTEKEMDDALKGRNPLAFGKNDGIAWDYPKEIYEGLVKCFTRMPKRIWNLIGRPDGVYDD